MLHRTWMSRGVQGKPCFFSDKITPTKEWGGGGASKPVTVKERARADRGSGMGKVPPPHLPPTFHFFSEEGLGKISKGGEDETVLHGRI